MFRVEQERILRTSRHETGFAPPGHLLPRSENLLTHTSDHVCRAWATEVQLAPVPLPPGEQPDYPWVREATAAWKHRKLQ